MRQNYIHDITPRSQVTQFSRRFDVRRGEMRWLWGTVIDWFAYSSSTDFSLILLFAGNRLKSVLLRPPTNALPRGKNGLDFWRPPRLRYFSETKDWMRALGSGIMEFMSPLRRVPPLIMTTYD